MEKRRINAPMSAEEAQSLKAGDQVLLSGTVYTARDAAHKRIMELLDALGSVHAEDAVGSVNAEDAVGSVHAEDAAGVNTDSAGAATGFKPAARAENAQAALPFPLQDAVIYYVGPTPPPADGSRPIGSAGPTTSGRMDAYAPRLHSLGVRATIGKGRRNAAVLAALQEHKCVYLGATGGAGALLSLCISAAEPVAFAELGPEAVYRLTVKDFPLLVLADSHGTSLYD